MELEGVHFKVTADTGQLELADAHVQKFAAVSETAQRSVDKFGNQLSQADKAAGRFVDSAGRMREKTGQFVAGLSAADKQMQQFSRNTTAMSTAATKTSSSFSAMRGATSQLSYQLQDIAVQAQMGTNAFIILAQQGPQIASVFGPGGAVLGAIIAVGAAIGGTLVGAMSDVEEQSKSLQDEILELAGRYDELTLAQRRWLAIQSGEEISTLQKELSSVNNQISSLQNLLNLPNASPEKLQEWYREFSRLRGEADNLQQQIDALNDGMDGMAGRASDIVSRLEEEAATIRMTAEERALYVLGLSTENEELLERASLAAGQISAYREEQEALREAEAERRRIERERDAAAKRAQAQYDRDVKAAQTRLQQISLLNKSEADQAKQKTDLLIAELERYQQAGILAASKVANARRQLEIKSNNELISSLRNLRGQLNPTERLYNQYYTLIQQIADSTLDVAMKTELMAEAYFKLQGDIEAANRELEEQRRKSDPLAQAWEEATKRIDDSFAKAWEGAFDSFESFADSIMASFKTLLANLAHQAITKPILISMGMAGAVGSGTASAAGVTDAAGGMSGVVNNISSLFGGSSIGTMISDIGGWIGGSSPIAGTGVGNYISGASANAANLANWQVAGGGMLGGLLSGALGLSGEYSAITGAAGTAIGTALLTPVLGPFAPLAGGFLGSALGGLIGNSEPSNYEGRTFAGLDTGVVSVGGQSGEKFSQENRDASENLAGAISNSIVGSIEGLFGADISGSILAGVGGRDPYRFLYEGGRDEYGKTWSFGMGRNNSQGHTYQTNVVDYLREQGVDTTGLSGSTRDINTYLDTITAFFATMEGIDISVYQSLADGNELLIDTIKRVELQVGLVTAVFDRVGESAGVTKEFADTWTQDVIAPLMHSSETLPDALVRIGSQFAVVTAYADRFGHSLGVTAEGLVVATDNIIQAAGGLNQFAASAESYYQNFYTEAERFDKFSADLTATFEELGYSLPTTREGFRAIVEGLDLTTESGQEMYATLLNLNPAVAQYIQGLETVGSVLDRLIGRADAALSGVMSAIRSERDAITERYNGEREAIMAAQSARREQIAAEMDAFRELERSYTALDRAYRRMQMTDSESVFSRSSGAVDYLRRALSSGVIPSVDELEPYLAAAQEPTEALYSSFEDYARQFFIAKNLIGELRERAGDQLTTDEKALNRATAFYDDQLKALERQYKLDMDGLDQQAEEAQALYDAVTGVGEGLMSVAEAINELHVALADLLKREEGSGGTFGTLPNGDTSVSYEDDPLTQAYRGALGRDPDLAGYKWYTEQIESGNKTLDQVLAEIAASEEAMNPSIRGFATGGMHSGGLRIVGERGPELEYTGPSRIMNNNDLMSAVSGGANTARAIKDMEQNLMAGLRAIEKNTREIKQLERRWDQQGLPEQRSFA